MEYVTNSRKMRMIFFLNFTTKHGEKIENANETDA